VSDKPAAVTSVTPPRKPSRAVFGALFFVAAATLVTPFQRDLFVGDETKYGAVVRDMRNSGHVFLPTLNGEPFTHKPPLHFWLIDLFTFPLGVNSMWAFVLPSILAFIALIWLMRRIGGDVAAFVCATSMLVWVSAQTARMDVSFTLFIVAALWLLERFFDRDDFRALLGSAVALGIATLIKGPMAPVIAIVLFLVEWWRRRRVPRGNYVPAIAALIVIPLAWFVPAMLVGGSAYTHEVIVKQTVGRAFATWVHKAPPWFYLPHMPATLFPWFFLAVFAIVKCWRERRFEINWILAVLLPYSVMSSKLDVYMMALIPAVALLIARCPISRVAILITIGFDVAIGIGGLFVKVPDIDLRPLLIFTIVISAIAFVVALRTSTTIGVLLAGLVPVGMFVFVGTVMMPEVNDIGSTRNLIAALERQHVPPRQIALYSCPYLWARDMPPDLERVIYADPSTFIKTHPAIIATARGHANEIATALAGYRRVDSIRMIGKWFDVYRH